MQPSSMTGDAQASSERFLLLLFSLMRLAILVQVTVASVVAWEHFRHPVLLVVLLAGVWTESVLLVEAGRRRGALASERLLAVDIATGMVSLWGRSEERRVGKECRSRW